MRYLPANARSKAAASYGARRKVFMSRLFDELQERIGSGTDESCISGFSAIGTLPCRLADSLSPC